MGAPMAKFRVTVGRQRWEMYDIEVEIPADDPRLVPLRLDGTHPDDIDKVPSGVVQGEDLLYKTAKERLEALEAAELLPDPHDEGPLSQDFSMEGFDVLVSPADAFVADLLDLRDEFDPEGDPDDG